MAVRFRVAGLTLSLRSRHGAPARLPERTRAFAADRGADISLDLTDEPVPVPAPSDLLFDSGGVWRVHRHHGGWLYTFRTPALSPPVYKAVAMDAGLRRGRLHAASAAARRRALEFPLDELLFQHRLALEGGMELHACGVVAGGRALLFCGRSGAGKSTLARLFRTRRVAILSDDRVVVRPRAERPWAWGTPWHGEAGFASPSGARLGAVLFLKKARRNRLLPLSPGEAAARLFARAFPPPWDRTGVERVLEACASVVQAVPCRVLEFRPETAALDLALGLLRPQPRRPSRSITAPTR